VVQLLEEASGTWKDSHGGVTLTVSDSKSKEGAKKSNSTPGRNYHEVAVEVAERATHEWKKKIELWLEHASKGTCNCEDWLREGNASADSAERKI
jgi:hypothetical protein